MEEVTKIATSLIAIDAKLKSTETALSTHKHKFADLLEKPTTLGGYGITDGMTATEVAAAIQQAISDLVNGSGAALDTLKELADALGNDPQFATTVGKALGLRVRVDDSQSFTLAQKAQGRSNLDALGTVDRGKADGVASLDGSGKVPTAQLPAMNYLPLAGGTMTGNIEIKRSENKVVRFLRADGTRAAAIWAPADTTTGFNIAVDDASGGGTKTFVFDVSGGLSVPASLAVAANIYIGASGQIASDGNIKGTRWGTGGVWLFDYLNSGNTRLGAFAFPRRWDGTAVQFQWAGQSGQPAWVWGGNGDGTVYQVWNPSNFSVNYANSAGYSGNSGALEGNNWGAVVNYINDRAYWRTQEYLANTSVDDIGMCSFVAHFGGGSPGRGGIWSGNDIGPCIIYKRRDNQQFPLLSKGGNFGFGSWRLSGGSLNATTGSDQFAFTAYRVA